MDKQQQITVNKADDSDGKNQVTSTTVSDAFTQLNVDEKKPMPVAIQKSTSSDDKDVLSVGCDDCQKFFEDRGFTSKRSFDSLTSEVGETGPDSKKFKPVNTTCCHQLTEISSTIVERDSVQEIELLLENGAEVSIVALQLEKMTLQEVKDVFEHHVKTSPKRLTKYFCIFCEYFGKKEHKNQLFEMMSICEDPAMIAYNVHIVAGLELSGFKYSEALKHVLNHNKNMSQEFIFVLVNMITDKRNDNLAIFINEMETFVYIGKYELNAIHINRLMEFCTSNRCEYNAKCLNFVRQVVSRSPPGELNAEILRKFTSNCRKANFCSSNRWRMGLNRKGHTSE